jgi:Cu/Ag efflux protein CusF
MRKNLVIALALLSPAWPSLAQSHNPAATPTATTAAPASGLPMVNAEVRRVDTGAGKVTLKHDDIPNLEMPAMTMVFQVRDPALLGQLKVGDQVRFTADKINGAYTVIELTTAP